MVRGIIEPGNVAAIRFTINGLYDGREVISLEHVNRIGLDAAPDWPSGNGDDVYRVDIDGSPSINQETAFRFSDGSVMGAAAVAGPAGWVILECAPSTPYLPSTTSAPAG